MKAQDSWRFPKRLRTCAETSSWTYYLKFIEIEFKNVKLANRKIHLDLPVAKEIEDIPVLSVPIYLIHLLGQEEFENFDTFEKQILWYYEMILPTMKRSETLFNNGEFYQLGNNLKELIEKLKTLPDKQKAPESIFLYYTGLGPSLIHPQHELDNAKGEIAKHLKICKTKYPTHFQDLLREFDAVFQFKNLVD